MLNRGVRRRAGTTLLILGLMAGVSESLVTPPALAQVPGVLIQGRVLWVAAEKMVIAPYVLVSGVGAVNVDLSQADQDEYAGLRTGDVVAVTGTVAAEGDRVIATSIQRLDRS